MKHHDLLEELEINFVRLVDLGHVKIRREVIEQYCDYIRQDLFDSLMERYPLTRFTLIEGSRTD